RARDLADDEIFVLTEYEDHATTCYQCVDTGKGGLLLCERGFQYASDVANYIFKKDRKAYSVVDKEHNKNILVHIPRGLKASRRLLLAIEYARLRPKQPDIDYCSAHPVVPSCLTKTITSTIKRAPRARHRIIVYRRTSSSRDSVYDSD
ncbi:hypothetical protein BGW36DRAFT_263098, partial [Talaromyces proteolyticus]